MNRIIIKPKSITRVLVLVASVLIILSVITQITAHFTGHPSMHGLIPFFNVDEELNLPTFFSGIILLIASFLLAIIYIMKKQSKEKDQIYWAILSLGFLYMTFDEIFMFHERHIGPKTKMILGELGNGIFQFTWLIWVIPIGIIVIILCFIFFKFWYRLPAKTRLTFLAAGIMYVGGAIGFELIEGLVANKHGEDNLLINFICTIQESLEMYGIIIFIWSLLDYLSEHYNELYFKFDGQNNSVLTLRNKIMEKNENNNS